MATTNLGLDELTGSEKLKTFPTLFNGDMETIDAAFGAAFGGSNKTVNQVLNAMQDGMAIVANGNSHGYIAAGQYVYVKNHGSLADGLYVSTAVIEANATLSGSNLTADAKGGLNALNSKIGGGMLTGGEPTEIEENEDLNNRKVPGVYLIRSGTVSYSVSRPSRHTWTACFPWGITEYRSSPELFSVTAYPLPPKRIWSGASASGTASTTSPPSARFSPKRNPDSARLGPAPGCLSREVVESFS